MNAISFDTGVELPPVKPNMNFSLSEITEEALDDWLAQSLNRPILSFFDPYKKFSVPQSLVESFKQRYPHLKKELRENPA
jgi:hypothetical protein